MKTVSKLFMMIAAIILLGSMANAATLSWDYPGDSEWENNLVGYNIYYSNSAGDQFNKALSKSDICINANSTRVLYENIENKLHLQYNVEYTLQVTAFDAGEESIRSNSTTYTRDGYSPPGDILPPAVIHVSGPITIIIGGD